jgi:hypothetical protein
VDSNYIISTLRLFHCDNFNIKNSIYIYIYIYIYIILGFFANININFHVMFYYLEFF